MSTAKQRAHEACPCKVESAKGEDSCSWVCGSARCCKCGRWGTESKANCQWPGHAAIDAIEERGHVRNCECHADVKNGQEITDTMRRLCGLVAVGEPFHKHPYRDPRCGLKPGQQWARINPPVPSPDFHVEPDEDEAPCAPLSESARERALEMSLKEIMGLLESNWLVRNIEHDAEPGYILKISAGVAVLARVARLLEFALAEKEGE